MEECGLCASAARQLIAYIVAGRAVLGAVPSSTTIIAERFFDEGGGQQLILHAPFGGRINKAWGLALRKRFCRGFNFELQAAATDNGINISLAEQHSFPLSDVFHFLTEQTAKALLEQAAIASPIFKTRWRWAANRSLQLLRMSKGKRIAPQIQRTRSEDLLASVFPQAAACFETIVGDIQIPDHPLVNEVMQDVLQEAMDLEGLNEILRGIAAGTIRCLAVDTAVPSHGADAARLAPLRGNATLFDLDADADALPTRPAPARDGPVHPDSLAYLAAPSLPPASQNHRRVHSRRPRCHRRRWPACRDRATGVLQIRVLELRRRDLGTGDGAGGGSDPGDGAGGGPDAGGAAGAAVSVGSGSAHVHAAAVGAGGGWRPARSAERWPQR